MAARFSSIVGWMRISGRRAGTTGGIRRARRQPASANMDPVDREQTRWHVSPGRNNLRHRRSPCLTRAHSCEVSIIGILTNGDQAADKIDGYDFRAAHEREQFHSRARPERADRIAVTIDQRKSETASNPDAKI